MDFIIKQEGMSKPHRLLIARPVLVGGAWMIYFCQCYYNGPGPLVYQNSKELKVLGKSLNRLGVGGKRWGKRVFRSVNCFSLKTFP